MLLKVVIPSVIKDKSSYIQHSLRCKHSRKGIKTMVIEKHALQHDLQEAEAIQQALIDDFTFLDDWTERYRYIIDLGKKLPELDAEQKCDENRIFGCQSIVWLVPRLCADGRIHFVASSDAMIVRGLIALLTKLYSGRFPETIAVLEPRFIASIGLDSHLSSTRNNGLLSMLNKVKHFAQQSKNSL